MKKKIISTYALTFCLGIVSATAAVTPPNANQVVAPQTSTADEPVWYIMMSSHLNDSNRQNRFLKWDGTNAVTEKFNDGMADDQITDAYRWRLDDTDNDGYIVFVNAANGLQITVPGTANATNNTGLTMTESGSKWEMKLSSATGQSDCADKQYCFDYVDYSGGSAAYLNAMPGANIPSYGITIYEAGVHQASGWFFYEAPKEEEVPTAIRETATTSFYYNAAAQTIFCGQPAHIVIYDITGKTRLEAQNTNQLSIASLPTGIYIANINGKPLKFTK